MKGSFSREHFLKKIGTLSNIDEHKTFRCDAKNVSVGNEEQMDEEEVLKIGDWRSMDWLR